MKCRGCGMSRGAVGTGLFAVLPVIFRNSMKENENYLFIIIYMILFLGYNKF